MYRMRLFHLRSSRRLSRTAFSLVLVLASAALLGAPALAQDYHDIGLDIGGTTVLVPVESGYVRVSERSPELHEYTQSNLPETNRLVETFHTEANLEAVLNRGQSQGHYMMVQTMREIEPMVISRKSWMAGRSDIKQGMVNAAQESLDSSAAEREASGHAVAERFEMIEAPVIYAETADSIRFLMRIADNAYTQDGKPVVTGAAGAIVHVRDKVVFLFWYARPATTESIDVARQKLDATVDRMVLVNSAAPPPAAGTEPAAAPESGTEPNADQASGSGSKMILIRTGIAVVFVVGLVLWLRSRGKKASP